MDTKARKSAALQADKLVGANALQHPALLDIEVGAREGAGELLGIFVDGVDLLVAKRRQERGAFGEVAMTSGGEQGRVKTLRWIFESFHHATFA